MAEEQPKKKKVTLKTEPDDENLPKWWVKPSVIYAFSHPRVRSKLEKLMGSNVVSLTDRGYMQKLQQRILEDYEASMMKRIKTREAEEMERVKNLVLTGKIPKDNAPPEMANHPIMLIEMYCRKLIAERRAKIKVPKVQIPTNIYWDDTPDPPSGLSIEKGHVFRRDNSKLCNPPELILSSTDEEDVERGYMFSEEDYERLMYESPLVKELRNCETVAEMYELAEEIIGELKLAEKTVYVEEDVSTLYSVTPNVDNSTTAEEESAAAASSE